jgi:hypothetical protein
MAVSFFVPRRSSELSGDMIALDVIADDLYLEGSLRKFQTGGAALGELLPALPQLL